MPPELLNGSQDVVSAIRKASRLLTPVVVDLGPNQPRLQSYFDSVQNNEGRAEVLLYPVAAQVIPPSGTLPQIHIRSADPADPFILTASSIRVLGDSAAGVDLSDARLKTMSPRHVARGGQPRNEPMVLVFKGVPTQFEANTFPVLDLTPHCCAVELSKPIASGTEFALVELYGERRMLRSAAAVVEECTPWHNAQGSLRFRCRLALSKAEENAPAQSYDLVSDVEQIRRIVRFAGKIGTRGWYWVPGCERGSAVFYEVGTDYVVLLLDSPITSAAPTPNYLRVGFEHIAVCYEMDVRMKSLSGDRLEVVLPLVLRRRRLRQTERTSVTEQWGVEVSFYNPVTGHTISRKVHDLSFGGICFADDESENVVWEGLPLEHAVLSWEQRQVQLGELEIRAVERTSDASLLCHSAFRTPGAAESSYLVDLVATLRHPNLEIFDGTEFEEVYRFYERAGLIGQHMKRNLSPEVPETWKRLFRKGSDVGRVLIHREGGDIDAAVSAVRPWERTWVLQHYGSRGPNGSHWAGELLIGILEYSIPRTDSDYLFFFVLPTSPSISFYERFIAVTGTPEALAKSSLYLWMLPADGHKPVTDAPHLRIRSLHKCDELLVCRAFERCLGAQMAKAMSILPGEIRLPDTRSRFKRVGLIRERSWSIITRSGAPAVALMHEVSSPGINLTWKLNASWLIPIHPELDRDGAATGMALDHAARQPTLTPTGDRFLFSTKWTDKELIESFGYKLVYETDVFILNRSGSQRFYHYTTRRYGEAGMLAEALEKRRGKEPL